MPSSPRGPEQHGDRPSSEAPASSGSERQRRNTFLGGLGAALLGIGSDSDQHRRASFGEQLAVRRSSNESEPLQCRPRSNSHQGSSTRAASRRAFSRRPSSELPGSSPPDPAAQLLLRWQNSTETSDSSPDRLAHALEEMAARLQRIEEAGCQLPEEAVTAAVLDAKLEEHQRRLEVAHTE